MPLVTLPFTIENGQLIDADPVMANFNALANAINTEVVPLSGPATLSGVFTFLNSPIFPTPSPGDNTTKGATTAFVQQAIGAIGAGGGGFKNKIINGSMTINQRTNLLGANSLFTGSPNYYMDRWGAITTITPVGGATTSFGQNQTPPFSGPTGFINWLKMFQGNNPLTIGATDTCYLFQRIEYDFIRDFAFGTANAATINLSFWLQSNQTGTFSGAILNGAKNRSYPFTYTITAANTWQFFSIAIPGDTSGSWNPPSPFDSGMELRLNFGSGANFLGAAGAWAAAEYSGATGSAQYGLTGSATFSLTGVQLEKGSIASSPEVYPAEYQLALCQRYFEKSFRYLQVPGQNQGSLGSVQCTTMRAGANFQIVDTIRYNTAKRINNPTITLYNPLAANAQIRGAGADWTGSAVTATSEFSFIITGTTPVSATAGESNQVHWTADAEL